eukprot:1847633-Pyramimonas_sp.AAC.1
MCATLGRGAPRAPGTPGAPSVPGTSGAPLSGHAQSVPGAPAHVAAHIGTMSPPAILVENQCAIAAGWPSWCL